MKKVLKNRELSKRLDLEEKVRKAKTPSKRGFITEEGGVLNKKVLDARSKAGEIVERADRDAEKIRAEAEKLLAQVETEFENAKKRGYKEGREEGLSSLTEQIAEFESIKEKFYDSSEENIIKLVVTVAEKVIGKIVQEQGEAIKSVVKQAIESSLGDRILVRVAPQDYKIVAEAESEFRAILDRTRRIIFKEDDSIEQGGCVVETEVGTIDARLETQLKAIKKALEL